MITLIICMFISRHLDKKFEEENRIRKAKVAFTREKMRGLEDVLTKEEYRQLHRQIMYELEDDF